jgi:uncharacterized protein YndB with AHSA1/START domain
MTDAFRTTIDIEAKPDVVFEYFVDPALMVMWMGDVARLQAKDGGLFAVDINGVIIRGHYVRVERPHLIEIAWGEAGNAQMPPGSTRVIVKLSATQHGTHVELEHHGLADEEMKKHAIGWPHFASRLTAAASGCDSGVDPWKKSPP